MEVLKLDNRNTTLVDSVEESLIRFFKEKGLRPGSSIPNEIELAASLGVGRPVLREALSRFKMNESTLRDILEFRSALEIGISNNIFSNLTPQDIEELEQIVEMSQVIGNNKYAPISEHRFHTKLYEITGNRIISEFQDIIYPVLDFVKEKYRDFFEPIEQELIQNSELVTHRHLLEYIKRGDLEGYKHAIVEHFKLYTIYLERHKR